MNLISGIWISFIIEGDRASTTIVKEYMGVQSEYTALVFNSPNKPNRINEVKEYFDIFKNTEVVCSFGHTKSKNGSISELVFWKIESVGSNEEPDFEEKIIER